VVTEALHVATATVLPVATELGATALPVATELGATGTAGMATIATADMARIGQALVSPAAKSAGARCGVWDTFAVDGIETSLGAANSKGAFRHALRGQRRRAVCCLVASAHSPT
jgi:hypothetical protein